MTKTPALVLLATAAIVAFATVASADNPPTSTPEPSQQSEDLEAQASKSVIAAIKDETTSVIEAEPKCGPETTLHGTLVMETPQRAGFPFTATTFASPGRTFTTVTTTEETSEAVIEAVAKTLNDRADLYVKRLLRNCSL